MTVSPGARHSRPLSLDTLRLVRDADAGRLPDPLTSFIGRDAELATVASLLRARRLVTLTGAGGSGKTRLAIEAARAAGDDFADGTCWVELAATSAVADVAQVAATVLAALGERPAATRAAVAQLADLLAARELLLVLDNCEHVVAACARLVEALLGAAPSLRVLATSREALGVPGEQLWQVPLLAVPSRASGETDVEAFAAVRLFVERARAHAPAFALTPANAAAVVEVCRRLDGLPLAIELAAARARVLAPEQIAARLDLGLLSAGPRTASSRQQTLQAAIEWSHALLAPAERALFARLSVFAGGWTLESAEAVCAGDTIAAREVLGHLTSLVDRSMVVVDPGEGATRFRLLETMREFAAARLEESGDADATRRRHAEHVLALAAAVGADVTRACRDETAKAFLPELENARAALRWSRDHAPDTFVRLTSALSWMLLVIGVWDEAKALFADALSLPLGSARGPERARLLGQRGLLASQRADLAVARELLQESVDIWTELGDTGERSHALTMLAQVYLFFPMPGALDVAARLAGEAIALAREVDDAMGLCWGYGTLGSAESLAGRHEDAGRSFAASLEIARATRHASSTGFACMALSTQRLAAGDPSGAARLLREGLAAHRRMPEHSYLPMTLQASAILLALAGMPVDALRLLGADDAFRHMVAATMGPAQVHGEAYVLAMRAIDAALDPAAKDAAFDEGRLLSLVGAIDLALEALAPVAGGEAHARDEAPPVLAPALRIVTLGPVRVERDGVPVAIAEWKYAKSRELLFLLLCHPQGRTREQIGLALWPDASSEQLRAALHPVLHHLRRVLGDPAWVVHQDGVYRFDRARDRAFAFDVDAFTRRLDEARATADPARRATLLAEAVAQYGGDFLEQAPPAGDWYLDFRDALARRFDQALAALGELSMQLGRPADAAAAWRRRVERDPLDEAAARALMRALAAAGEPREALRSYDRLAATLARELDAEPDAETRALRDRISRGA